VKDDDGFHRRCGSRRAGSNGSAGRRSRFRSISDLDAHCGGGTHSIVYENPAIWNLDVSVSGFDN